MSGKRVIKMTNQGIFFNEKEYIPYDDTNLPKKYFSFSERAQIYWLTDMSVDFRNGRKVITVHVNDYNYYSIDAFKNQVKKGETTFFIFENLDFDAFFAKCTSYQAGKFKELFSNFPTNNSAKNNNSSTEQLPITSKSANNQIIFENEVQFRVNFSDATIIDGGIQFTKKIEEMGFNIEFIIFNEFLKASYEPIKKYFAKKIGRKTFSVIATIKRVDWKVAGQFAQSKEIDQINGTFIDTIKYDQIKSLLKIKQSDIKQLYSIDEMLLQSDELQGNLFKTDIENTIQVLTKNYTHRNSKQLSYLANSHRTEEEIIHLTISPYFGFVFFSLTTVNFAISGSYLIHTPHIFGFSKRKAGQKSRHLIW